MISILICDDQVQLTEAIAKELHVTTNYQILNPVYSGEACLAYLKEHEEPTILILDVSMPKGMNGYEVAKYVQTYHPKIKIITNTMFGNKDVLYGMIRYGVKAFVSKDNIIMELVHAINAVLNNEYYFPESYKLTQQEIIQIQNSPIPWLEAITSKEKILANLLNEGKSLKEASSEMNISESVASKKRTNLLKKTKTDNTVSMLNKLKTVCLLWIDKIK
jgi:DNA-binding NarL/FixJ family response regulator